MIGLSILTRPEWTEIISNSLDGSLVVGVEMGLDRLMIYFESMENAKAELNSIDELHPDYILSSEIFRVEKKNWNEIWESNFKPVEIDNFCRIRAPFHSQSEKYKFEIIINPEMAFGTGHHATTSMMIKSMRNLDFKGKTVFDFGCGTGILSILACYLGAKDVIGNDIELEAVTSAIKNAKLNKVENVRVIQEGLEGMPSIYPDIVLANINRNVLLDSADILHDLLKEKGKLLLSGILKEDKDMILQAYSSKFDFEGSMEDEGWLCFLFQKDFKAS